MKILFVLLILLLSCNNSTKKEVAKTPIFFERECGCFKDFNSEYSFSENRSVILTNVRFENKNSQKFITGNCTDVIRKYISDPNGEYETEEVDCISKDQITLKISDSTKFQIYFDGPEAISNEQGKKNFFDQLAQNYKAIFEIEVSKKKEVALMISRRENLEKTD